jgi:hypothetical protein
MTVSVYPKNIEKAKFVTGATESLDIEFTTLICNSASAMTVNLPAAANLTGIMFTIKNINTGTVTIDGNGSETIDGSTTTALETKYSSITIVSNGTGWVIV